MTKPYNYHKHRKNNLQTYETATELLKTCDEYKTDIFYGIKLIGNPKFQCAIKAAISIMQTKDYINYQRTVKYIKEIVMVKYFGAGRILLALGIYLKSEKEALNDGEKWLASCIVHEAIHCIIFEKLTRRGLSFSKFRTERACVKAQTRFLKRLGEFIPDENAYIKNIMSTKWYLPVNSAIRLLRLDYIKEWVSEIAIKLKNKIQATVDITKTKKLNALDAAVYYNDQGVRQLERGDFKSALQNFTKAIQANPAFANAYLNRGHVHYDEGRYIDAISDLTKAIQLNPNSTDSYNIRGASYYEEGNFDQAILDQTKAIEIDPKFSYAYECLALSYFKKEEYDKSWENLHKAEKLGLRPHPQFLEDLKAASRKDKQEKGKREGVGKGR